MNHIEQIYSNFSSHYDERIAKIIPSYRKMLNTMASAIPFSHDEAFSVIDLGCGTGNLAFLIKANFPNAKIVCLDVSKEMVKIAEQKHTEYKDDVRFEIADFENYQFDQPYDVVVSAVAIHHLTSEQQFNLYERIFNALSSWGVFINAEHVLGGNDYLSRLYTENWATLMRNIFPFDEAENIILTAHDIDLPVTLPKHFEWLSTIGFQDVDILWKENQLAVIYAGRTKR